MGLTQTSPPATEPITLTQAKLFLRIDTTDEDALITALIVAARERVEQHTDRQLVTASYLFTTNKLQWPMCTRPELLLPRPPLQSVASVATTDASGTVATVNASTYSVVIDTTPGRIVFSTEPAFDYTVPNGLAVTFTCGYGNAAAVPQGLVVAMYWLIEQMYRRVPNEDVEAGVERLLNTYRAYQVGS